MKFLYQTNPEMRALIKRSDVDLQNKFKAIEMSSISTLQWSWERNVRKNTGENVWWYQSTSFCHKLAQTNKLELLKWAREEKNCDIWDGKTTIAAIKQGNVEMLKYCLENDCPTSSAARSHTMEDVGQSFSRQYLSISTLPCFMAAIVVLPSQISQFFSSRAHLSNSSLFV
jgi:hypothetical protein